MAEWISTKEAAKKYNIDESYIQLWVDMKAVTAYFKDGRNLVYDESLQGILKVREQGDNSVYVRILERFCIGRSETCITYAYLLGARDKELLLYKEAQSERDTLRRMWLEQNEQMRDLAVELALEQDDCHKCWLKKLCLKVKKISKKIDKIKRRKKRQKANKSIK